MLDSIMLVQLLLLDSIILVELILLDILMAGTADIVREYAVCIADILA